MSDLYRTSVSVATILNASWQSYNNLAHFEESLIDALTDSKILHIDKSGAITAEKLYWLHSASTELLTFYGVHEKGGCEAMDHFDILPNFHGRLIHDFWKPYSYRDPQKVLRIFRYDLYAHVHRMKMYDKHECVLRVETTF